MLQKDIGAIHEVLVGLLQIGFVEGVAIVIAAVVFPGGYADDPEIGIPGILGNGIPEFLDFSGRCFDKGRVYETDPGFAGLWHFVAKVDDLVHTGGSCWLWLIFYACRRKIGKPPGENLPSAP